MCASIEKCLSFVVTLCFCLAACPAEGASRVAVFDPQVQVMSRFEMNLGEMNGIADALRQAGMDVGRVTTEQIDDPKIFNAKQFDVLVLRGDAVPRDNFPQLKQFASDGGVVVAMSAKAPFLTAVAKTPKGSWTYSPETPQFAWQTQEIMNVFGLGFQYRPAMLDSGVRHTATSLFKKYLPDAHDFTGALPSTWIFQTEGGDIFPLMRSRRGDGRDVTPQVYIARKDGHYAVISSGSFWVKGGDGWTLGPQTTVALVKVALDLHSGALKPSADDRVDIPSNLPSPEPLTSRVPTGEVNPDDAPVLTRWGKFDGSGIELDEKLTGHPSLLPRVLKGGGTVTLPLTQNGKPLWLRVRAGVAQSGAGLKIAVGDRTLWNESIAYAEVADVGNFGKLSLSDAPVEFNRRVFIPPSDATNIVISNPGTKPLYFDAVQIENDPAKPVRWLTGMGASDSQNRLKGKFNLPSDIVRDWTGQRSTLWAQDVGKPGDPKRWDKIEARFKAYLSTGAPVELLIEGVPEWAAISEARYKAAERKWTVPPDLSKYTEIVDYVLKHHAKDVARFEIWNEEDSQHYFLGSAKEFVKTWKTIVPMVRKAAPGKQVYVGGLTGFDKSFLETLSREGVLKEADMIGFHPYAGAEAAWDKPFGTFQGQLYSLGENLPIYNNEMGFPSGAVGWFTKASFPYNLATQRRMTEVSLARLLANNVTMFCLFLSGGSDDAMGYIDANGKGKPAYTVVQDYMKLSQRDGQRFDISMSRTDGAPQTGVYLAGARHDDGSMTVIINPTEVVPPKFDAPADAPEPEVYVPLTLRIPLSKQGDWKAEINGKSVPLQVTSTSGDAWGELNFTLTKRSILTLNAR